MSSLTGTRLLIIGGTAGMGRAIAEHGARAGAEVIVAGRSADRARRVAEEIGPACSGVGVDATDEVDTQRMFTSVGEIDHLVTAAANVAGSPLRELDVKARESFEGKFWLQHRCVRLAEVRKSILMFSGAYSRRPAPGMSAVAAINGAVEALGRALALELAPVRVNVLSPGLVQGTEAFAGMTEEARASMMATVARRLPTGFVGNPDSIAEIAIAILASNYITGAVVDVDGGGLLT